MRLSKELNIIQWAIQNFYFFYLTLKSTHLKGVKTGVFPYVTINKGVKIAIFNKEIITWQMLKITA